MKVFELHLVKVICYPPRCQQFLDGGKFFWQIKSLQKVPSCRVNTAIPRHHQLFNECVENIPARRPIRVSALTRLTISDGLMPNLERRTSCPGGVLRGIWPDSIPLGSDPDNVDLFVSTNMMKTAKERALMVFGCVREEEMHSLTPIGGMRRYVHRKSPAA